MRNLAAQAISIIRKIFGGLTVAALQDIEPGAIVPESSRPLRERMLLAPGDRLPGWPIPGSSHMADASCEMVAQVRVIYLQDVPEMDLLEVDT